MLNSTCYHGLIVYSDQFGCVVDVYAYIYTKAGVHLGSNNQP